MEKWKTWTLQAAKIYGVKRCIEGPPEVGVVGCTSVIPRWWWLVDGSVGTA